MEFKLLKQLHDKSEELKGRRLILALVVTFVIFLFIGIGAPVLFDFTNVGLKKPEPKISTDTLTTNPQEKYYKGVITYVGTDMYKADGVEYVLTDENGKELVLLTASDSKLKIFEGMPVGVKGTLRKSSSGKDLLTVSEVILNN